MSYYGWQSFYRNASRFIGDMSGEVGRWYDRNKGKMPSSGAPHRSSGIPGLVRWGEEQFNRAWDNSHGRDRYWLSQVPGWGWGKQMAGQADYYEDYYKHTGVDPKYPQTYSGYSGGLVGALASQVGNGSPARWARSLEGLFPVKYEENLSRSQAFSKGYW